MDPWGFDTKTTQFGYFGLISTERLSYVLANIPCMYSPVSPVLDSRADCRTQSP